MGPLLPVQALTIEGGAGVYGARQPSLPIRHMGRIPALSRRRSSTGYGRTASKGLVTDYPKLSRLGGGVVVEPSSLHQQDCNPSLPALQSILTS